jgi:hypothetical protein
MCRESGVHTAFDGIQLLLSGFEVEFLETS